VVLEGLANYCVCSLLQASEFKHSEFRANRKDNLDSIRRKNPAPKKSMIADEQMTTANSINILNELATTTQQQVQQLQDKIREMTQSQRLMLGEIANLHKVINAQKQSQHELLNYLSFSRRESRSSTAAPSAGNSNPTAASSSDGLDELPQELRQARELLTIADRELERSGAVYASPMESPSGIFTQPSTSANMGISSDPMTDITRYPIYPVGQTVGIDPFHSDHINNIPYQLPSNQTMSYSAAPAEPALSAPTSAQQGSSTSVWGRQKPKVLLVEDDQTCSRIGAKFLTTMDCTVEVAPDGVEAVQKVNNAPEYFDLIFMDIVMPGLDGASATDLIRHVAPTIPVIAMTSNIKPEDVQWYAEHGTLSSFSRFFFCFCFLALLTDPAIS
jgi:osomolarity two-component system response regulator SKN7